MGIEGRGASGGRAMGDTGVEVGIVSVGPFWLVIGLGQWWFGCWHLVIHYSSEMNSKMSLYYWHLGMWSEWRGLVCHVVHPAKLFTSTLLDANYNAPRRPLTVIPRKVSRKAHHWRIYLWWQRISRSGWRDDGWVRHQGLRPYSNKMALAQCGSRVNIMVKFPRKLMPFYFLLAKLFSKQTKQFV